jgi:DNA-binding GntR family transcriptional regulator
MRKRTTTANASSQKERVYGRLRQDLLTLALRPGSVIVETDIARRFRVSRTPVREALTLLQRDGLVEAMPRRGYLVSSVTMSDVRDLFELRVALEGAAAELAATRITPEELQHLDMLTKPPQALLREVKDQPNRKTMETLLDYNREFHMTIARASRNPRLVTLIERVLDDMMRMIASGYFADEHGDIVEAFRGGDPQRARTAVVNHVLMTQERVLKGEGLRP